MLGKSATRFRLSRFRIYQLSLLLACALLVVVATAMQYRVESTLKKVFFVWFVGFLAGVELFVPRRTASDGWGWVRWAVVAGSLVAAFLTVSEALEVVG